MAQKWADQCADVDYKGDHKRRDPSLFHDSHPNRKIGRQPSGILIAAITQNFCELNHYFVTERAERQSDKILQGGSRSRAVQSHPEQTEICKNVNHRDIIF